MLDKTGTYNEVEKDESINYHPSFYWDKIGYLETPICNEDDKPNDKG